MFGAIDHVGVAVEDIDAAAALYKDRLGMREQHRETVEEQGVHAVLLEVGDSHVELIAPISAARPASRASSRRTARACTTWPTARTTSTPRSSACARPACG